MATFCLLPNKAEQFRKALKEKKINLADLLHITSEARTKLLEQYAGKDAGKVNLLFEQKLVLKNKILGIKNWASKVGEIGRYSPKKKGELARLADEYAMRQKERIFSPKENEAFLNDLADAQLGTHITKVEAGNIFKLTKKVEDLKENFNPETGEWKSEQGKLDYGANKVILENYIESLKTENLTIKEMVLERYYEGRATFKENKAKAVTDLLKDTARKINDNAIAFVAAVDNSFLGRQGLNTLLTRPSIWWDMSKKSFIDIYQALRKKEGGNMAKDSLMSEVYGRENYLNGNYDLAKLIPRAEEQFPTTLPERLPLGIGRIFKASEVAFTNSAIRARINLFDKIYEIAKKNGVNIKDVVEIKEMGHLINSVTARGSLGKMGEGGVIKALLWAPKMLKADWDVLTAHTGGAGLKTKFARQQARYNLVKIVASTTAVVAIINAIKPGSVETDPTSSDFLKIKVGDTRTNISGGKGSIITLLARGVTLKTKSTATGIKKKLNTGEFGSKTYFDIFIDFLSNKTTPFAKAVIDRMKGRDFEGKVPTWWSSIYGITTPISIQNFVKTYYGDDTDGTVAEQLGNFLDLIGISANTYSNNENWDIKDTKEINQFREEVSEAEFKKANNEYNKIIRKSILELTESEEYKKLNDDDKMKKIEQIKKKAKKYIFETYNP